jgi:hypothetical protein
MAGSAAINIREVVNDVLCLNRAGCQWWNLPHSLPPVSPRRKSLWHILLYSFSQKS